MGKRKDKDKPKLEFHKGTQEPILNNLEELAVWMESFKMGTGMKNDYFLNGVDGLKLQLEKANTGKFKEKEEAMLFYLAPDKDSTPEQPSVLVRSIWINKKTGEKCVEPEWFKELKKNEKEKQ